MQSLPNKKNLNQPVFESVCRLDRLSGGVLLQRLFSTMEDCHADIIENFETWQTEENWQQVSQNVHSLNGKASTLGAANIREACIAIEESIENKSFENLTDQFEILKSAWKEDHSLLLKKIASYTSSS